jgi:mono/diheme cytochrome c family protein
MTKRTLRISSLLVALCVAAGGAWAQAKGVDLGQREYMANCASCHGADGKGQGPTAMFLNKSPTNLTVLAKNNGGILPAARLYESIDGTATIAGHGTREMPTWGFDYRVKAAEYYMDTPYNPEVYVRGKILSLIDYISRIQVK